MRANFEVCEQPLRFEDLEAEAPRQHKCKLCEMAEQESVGLQYMSKLERALLKRNSASTYAIMRNCWERYIREPLLARGEDCVSLSEHELRQHFTEHVHSPLRTLLRDVARLEQLQRNLTVFSRKDNGDVQTDAGAAKAFSQLQASKMEVLKLLARRDTDSDDAIPDPPDLHVLMH